MSNLHGMKKFNELDHFCNCAHDQNIRTGKFGRLFPELPALYSNPDILRALGAKSGPMDGGANANRTNTVSVGQVFFGQFVDHDITLDTTSSFTKVNEESDITNVRTPTLDLDNIYGSGPEASPFLYVQTGDFAGVKLLTGADGTAANQTPDLAKEDLVRSPHGTAVIGDPRNDENRIISQLQLGMIRFHNNVVEHLSSKYTGHELYEEARQLVIYHYHWAVLHDFLVDMCGAAVVWDILHNGREFYCIDEAPYIPVEFSISAYRFGHSMVPQKIQVQKNESAKELFGTTLGHGFTPLANADAIVDWHELFHTSENRQVQKAEKLDTKLASDLLALPFITNGENSLATRNLLRGQSFLMPSGENIALLMGRSEAEIKKVSDKANASSSNTLGGKTPLWYYLLTEAEEIGRETSNGSFDKAEGLGPVGARLVAEVIIGLMELDPNSFLAKNRAWSPIDGLGEGVKGVGDMLTYSS